MSVFRKLFGAKQNVCNSKGDNYIETIIAASKDNPLAISDKNVLYSGYNELGGYYFLQTFIIGALKIKTKNGAKLLIECKNSRLELNADMNELESDKATPLKAYITKIDFQIEKGDVENLVRTNINEIKLLINDSTTVFSIYSKK